MFDEFSNDGFVYDTKGDQVGWHGQVRNKSRKNSKSFRLPSIIKWIVIIYALRELFGSTQFSWAKKHVFNNYEFIGLIAIVVISLILYFVIKRIFNFIKKLA